MGGACAAYAQWHIAAKREYFRKFGTQAQQPGDQSLLDAAIAPVAQQFVIVRRGRERGVACDEIDRPAIVRIDQAEIPEFARSEEHTSELQSLMRISYAVFCLKKKIVYKKKYN